MLSAACPVGAYFHLACALGYLNLYFWQPADRTGRTSRNSVLGPYGQGCSIANVGHLFIGWPLWSRQVPAAGEVHWPAKYAHLIITVQMGDLLGLFMHCWPKLMTSAMPQHVPPTLNPLPPG